MIELATVRATVRCNLLATTVTTDGLLAAYASLLGMQRAHNCNKAQLMPQQMKVVCPYRCSCSNSLAVQRVDLIAGQVSGTAPQMSACRHANS